MLPMQKASHIFKLLQSLASLKGKKVGFEPPTYYSTTMLSHSLSKISIKRYQIFCHSPLAMHMFLLIVVHELL